MINGLIMGIFAQLIGYLRWKTILKRSQVCDDENCVDDFEYKGKKYSKSKCMQAIYDILICKSTRHDTKKMLESLEQSSRKNKDFSILDQLYIETILQVYPDMRNQHADNKHAEDYTENIKEQTDQPIGEKYISASLSELHQAIIELESSRDALQASKDSGSLCFEDLISCNQKINSVETDIQDLQRRLKLHENFGDYISFQSEHPYHDGYNGNINPYNGKEITCEKDYNEYLMMSIDEKAKNTKSEDVSISPLPEIGEPNTSDPINKAKPRKKRNRKMIIFIILIIILIIAGGIGCYYSYDIGFGSGNTYGSNNGYKKSYSAGYDSGRDVGYRKGYDEGYNSISDEYKFFHNSAVIVTTTGNKYHHYGCDYIRNSDIYIYNIENAEYKGYTPCYDCFQ